MLTKATLLTIILAALLTATASAAPTARQFTHSLGTYELAVDQAVRVWKNTGTDCVFRSGRTVVFCLTTTTKWGRITTTMRRVSATRVRFTLRFIDEGPSRTWVAAGQ